jgi:hypothetical protein
MTPQEKELLQRFLADMAGARAGQKDPEAEALIREAVSRHPDAAYLLVQRALQLDQVLQMRETEVRKLQNELAQAKAGGAAPAAGGFIGDPYAWGSQARSAPPAAAQSAGSAPIPGVQPQAGGIQPQAGGVQPQAAVQQPASRPWGGSSMLGTVATTAAGVVAGSFLYQGIQNLMHHNDQPAAAGDRTQSAEHHAQPLLGDSSGFEDVVPDDGDLYAASGDDSDSDVV